MTVTAFLASDGIEPRAVVASGFARTTSNHGAAWPKSAPTRGRPSTRRRDALLNTPDGQALQTQALKQLGDALDAHGLSPLVALRLRKGLSQKALCDASGLLQPHVSRLENGKVPNPDFVTLNKLAQALGVPIGDVLLAVQPEGLKR